MLRICELAREGLVPFDKLEASIYRHDPMVLVDCVSISEFDFPKGTVNISQCEQLEMNGPVEFDISKLKQTFHPRQVAGEMIPFSDVYLYLEENKLLDDCLGFSELLAIKKKGYDFFSQHVPYYEGPGALLIGWKTTIRGANGDFHVISLGSGEFFWVDLNYFHCLPIFPAIYFPADTKKEQRKKIDRETLLSRFEKLVNKGLIPLDELQATIDDYDPKVQVDRNIILPDLNGDYPVFVHEAFLPRCSGPDSFNILNIRPWGPSEKPNSTLCFRELQKRLKADGLLEKCLDFSELVAIRKRKSREFVEKYIYLNKNLSSMIFGWKTTIKLHDGRIAVPYLMVNALDLGGVEWMGFKQEDELRIDLYHVFYHAA